MGIGTRDHEDDNKKNASVKNRQNIIISRFSFPLSFPVALKKNQTVKANAAPSLCRHPTIMQIVRFGNLMQRTCSRTDPIQFSGKI